MSAAEGEPEGIGAKADIILDAVAAIIEQPMAPRFSTDLKRFKASLDGDAPRRGDVAAHRQGGRRSQSPCTERHINVHDVLKARSGLDARRSRSWQCMARIPRLSSAFDSDCELSRRGTCFRHRTWTRRLAGFVSNTARLKKTSGNDILNSKVHVLRNISNDKF